MIAIVILDILGGGSKTLVVLTKISSRARGERFDYLAVGHGAMLARVDDAAKLGA